MQYQRSCRLCRSEKDKEEQGGTTLNAWMARISGFSTAALGITMDKRQLLLLCLSSTFMTFNGTTTVSLMPVYAIRLGADATLTGFFVAVSYLAVTFGNIIGGWLSDRTDMRKPIILIGCVVWLPLLLWLTQANDIRSLILISALGWLPGGMVIAATNIITGLSAGEGERGKVFGWTKVFAASGGLLAGAVGGVVIERWGWPMLFVVMAATVVMLLLIATQLKDDSTRPHPKQSHPHQREAGEVAPHYASLGGGMMLMLMLIAQLLVRLSQLTGGLAAPLTMTDLGFNAAEIASTIAVSAAITLPLPLLLGWLSDKAGRRRFLIFCYVAGTLGVLVMIPATWLWQFWLATSLIAISNSASGVAQAYVVDLVPRSALGRGMSWFNSTFLFAGVIGAGGAGFVIQNLGTDPALFIAASLSMVAIVLLLQLRAPLPVASEPNVVQV